MDQSNELRVNDQQPDHKPAGNERVPGQGNSSDGLTRRLGADTAERGKKEQSKLKEGEGNGEEERIRNGSQGVSKGQKG